MQAHCRTAAFIKDGHIIISDRVDKLENTGAKKIVLRGTLSDGFIGRLKEKRPDVTDLIIEDKYVSYLYSGDITELLSVLAAEKPKDVSITEPTMEEIFMNYYE